MAIKMKQFLEALTAPTDRLVDEIRNVKENSLISNAVGEKLQFIKKIVVLESGETDDELLRSEIETEIVINNSYGEHEALSLAIETIFGVISDNYRIDEIGDAKLRIHIIGGDVTTNKFKKFKKVVTGGVGTYVTASSDIPFVFAGGNGGGFGSFTIGSGVGGHFSEYINQ